MTVFAYLRVSTDVQDIENQRKGIQEHARVLGINIDTYVTDNGVSGMVNPENRKFGNLLKRVKSGDVIIVSELSRISRRLFVLFRILENLLEHGVAVYSVKDGYSLDNTIQSKVLAFAFGMAAEIERDMISMRTREALAVKRANGGILGRPHGVRNKTHKLDGKYAQIQQMINNGMPKIQIARRFNVSIPTLYKYIMQNKTAP